MKPSELHSHLLDTYLSKASITSTEFARAIGVSPSFVYQWRTGRRPIPVELHASVERASHGQLLRAAMRPDDYWLIWPDLNAPTIPQENPHA